VLKMGADTTEFILLRVSRRAAKNIGVIAIVGCLAITGLAAAMGERSLKGDRLQLALKRTSTSRSPLVTTLSQRPIGCEPAFSFADAKRSHVFGRCIS
jgi:hypothetical protein